MFVSEVTHENPPDPRANNVKYIEQKFQKRCDSLKFEPTQFIIDDDYVGDPPKVQVSFFNINDNINEKFLTEEISRVGKIRSLEIVRDSSRRHLGLAKVQFFTPEAAEQCLKHYNKRSMMGKQLTVELDVRFAMIEDAKERALRPQINHIRHPEPIPIIQQPIPTNLPPRAAPLPMHIDYDNSNRSHAQFGSLDERLSKMGLVQHNLGHPTNPPTQVRPLQHRNHPEPQPQFLQNHRVAGLENGPRAAHALPPQPSFQEDEDAWNPPNSSPPKKKLSLTEDQLSKIVLPSNLKFFDSYFTGNIKVTVLRQLVLKKGFPFMYRAQEEFKTEQNRIELEQRKQEQENIKKQWEENALLRVRHKDLEKRFLGRDIRKINETRNNIGVHVRHRTGNDDIVQGRTLVQDHLKRINRASAFVDETRDYDAQRGSSVSSNDSLSRRSRSRDRSRMGSESRSSSSSSSESLDSSSSSGSSSLSSLSSRSSSSSSSKSSSSSRRGESSAFRITVESANVAVKSPLQVEDKEEFAANALLDLQRQTNALEKIDQPSAQPATKKRKTKFVGQENRVAKRPKTSGESSVKEAEPSPKKPITVSLRTEEQIEALVNKLSIDDEDVKYLYQVHEKFENDRNRVPRTPFGSLSVNETHLLFNKSSIESEKIKNSHPKWWNGCSRCSPISISDKGTIEETVYDESQRALIKSHVIQAAKSTRRDQKNDQRRLTTLNKDMDPALLKHFTSNTLQMRAKNLRFSRSKIHKWGLFACEKIASGDAVIEYVGEKIRPSVADHREKVVYTNLPTHDGSSYFFRVDSDVIDATLKGNKARFINHSCNPNCIAKVIKHDNYDSIVIYAKQAIDEDEEITYDYKFPREEELKDKIKCRCKAPNCQKYLN